jgi:hypothetical protein
MNTNEIREGYGDSGFASQCDRATSRRTKLDSVAECAASGESARRRRAKVNAAGAGVRINDRAIVASTRRVSALVFLSTANPLPVSRPGFTTNDGETKALVADLTDRSVIGRIAGGKPRRTGFKPRRFVQSASKARV